MDEEEGCLCRPIGFLLGLPFMLLSGLLSLVGIVVWVIATILICIFPCGVCLAAVISFAIYLIKLPLRDSPGVLLPLRYLLGYSFDDSKLLDQNTFVTCFMVHSQDSMLTPYILHLESQEYNLFPFHGSK